MQTKENKTMHQEIIFPEKFKHSPSLRVWSDDRKGSLHLLLTVESGRLKACATDGSNSVESKQQVMNTKPGSRFLPHLLTLFSPEVLFPILN